MAGVDVTYLAHFRNGPWIDQVHRVPKPFPLYEVWVCPPIGPALRSFAAARTPTLQRYHLQETVTVTATLVWLYYELEVSAPPSDEPCDPD